MSQKPSRERPAWFFPAIVMAAAVLIGALVLPRFGHRLEGAVSPDFSLPIVFGGEPEGRVKLSEQRGKLVLLDFWASWCKPCREQAHVLEAVAKGNSKVVVIGINVSDSPPAAQRYLADAKPPWVVLEDSEDLAAQAYQVKTLPTLVVIDREGKVFAVRRHFVAEGELRAMLEVAGGG